MISTFCLLGDLCFGFVKLTDKSDKKQAFAVISENITKRLLEKL